MFFFFFAFLFCCCCSTFEITFNCAHVFAVGKNIPHLARAQERHFEDTVAYILLDSQRKRSNEMRVIWSIIKLVRQSVGLQKVGYLSQTVHRVLGGLKDNSFGKKYGTERFFRISSQLSFFGLKL